MNREESEEAIHETIDELRRKTSFWRDGKVPIDGVTTYSYANAKRFERLACAAALLGAVTQSREYFSRATQLYHNRVVAGRLQRDITERIAWEGEPRILSRTLNAALLSWDRELTTTVARDALELDDVYLDEFADDYPNSPLGYYQVKAKAALVLNDERAVDLVSDLSDAVQKTDDPSQYWLIVPEFYRAVDAGAQEAAQSALERLLAFYAERDPDSEDPRTFVLQTLSALVILARQRRLDVTVDSDRVPSAVVQEAVPADERRLEVDLSDVEFTSPVGFFELEYDEESTPVIIGRIYHSGQGDVTADDVPEREAGRVLSDEWVEAALDEARWRDHYVDDLVEDAVTAYRDGSLLRKLVVVQDRTDGGTFDETLSTLPVDTIQLLKGAGRK